MRTLTAKSLCTQIKDTSSQATTGMRQLYERHLLAYERHCKAQDARRAAAPVLPLNGEVGDQLAAQILEAMLKAEPEDAAALASEAEPEGPPVKRRKVAVQVSACLFCLLFPAITQWDAACCCCMLE